jgi:predicted Zn-dependent protease
MYLNSLLNVRSLATLSQNRCKFVEGFTNTGLAIAGLAVAGLCTGPLYGQPPAVGDAINGFDQMVEAFADNAGPFAPLFGRLSPEQVQRLSTIEISVEDEREFGQQVLDAYLKQLAKSNISVVRQGKDVAYLLTLLNVIRPSMTHAARYPQLDVRVINVDSSDAYSIPGAHLLVTRGLLETAVSEAAVVGVLAHELSHLDRGHQLNLLKQSKLASKPLSFDDTMLSISLIARPFRPEQESEADGDATRWMMSGGYQPREFVKLLSRWGQQQNQQSPWLQAIPSLAKSHPDPSKRVQNVLAHIQQNELRYPNAKFVGVKNLQQRQPRNPRP